MGFLINSILLGVGLSVDAFSVSVANGLAEPSMRARKKAVIAGTFAFFQALMPMLGYFFVRTLVSFISAFGRLVPVIALILLGYIGIKMIISGVKRRAEDEKPALSAGALFTQGIATSIDALSVGFTMSDYMPATALWAALVIAAVTFLVCTAGVNLGTGVGKKLANKAEIFGGAILIFIGLEIFIRSLL